MIRNLLNFQFLCIPECTEQGAEFSSASYRTARFPRVRRISEVRLLFSPLPVDGS
jgi:hypothetical protein